MERTNECLYKMPAIDARMLVIVIHCVPLARSCNCAHASLATPTWQIRRAAESAKTAASMAYGSPHVTMDHIIREQLESLLRKHVPEASIG